MRQRGFESETYLGVLRLGLHIPLSGFVYLRNHARWILDVITRDSEAQLHISRWKWSPPPDSVSREDFSFFISNREDHIALDNEINKTLNLMNSDSSLERNVRFLLVLKLSISSLSCWGVCYLIVLEQWNDLES